MSSISASFLGVYISGTAARARNASWSAPAGRPAWISYLTLSTDPLVHRVAHPVVPRLHNGLILNPRVRPHRTLPSSVQRCGGPGGAAAGRYQLARRRSCSPRRLRRRRLRNLAAGSACRAAVACSGAQCGAYFRGCRRKPHLLAGVSFRVGIVGTVGTVAPPSPVISRFVFAVAPPPRRPVPAASGVPAPKPSSSIARRKLLCASLTRHS
jgi:hypothetical protein